ncbi:MAG: flavin reductase family protein [Candidatus Eremiobacteraeota bacterium]|nr:flavin reductase family protein [Candidatus Eremiobacteraeota bacterium]
MRASTDDFRAAMRRFVTGVSIVTTSLDDRIHGFTVNAFASVSADPPTVLICVNRVATAHPLIAASQHFCVNILALEQRALAERFAGGEPRSRFDGVAYRIGPSGSPVLEGTVAHVDCRVTEELTASTHTIFLGEVLEAGSRDGEPLGYFNRAYRDLALRRPRSGDA